MGTLPSRPTLPPCPGWKRDVGRRLDALVVRTVPGVRKAVKWNSPFYRIEDQGWFLSVHCFTKYVKVAFFRGASLRPLPPGESKQKDVRYLDIHENDRLDEELVASWIRQAAQLLAGSHSAAAPAHSARGSRINARCRELASDLHRSDCQRRPMQEWHPRFRGVRLG
jgi:hypothetical protein